jgi:hypothetical protein
VFLADRDVAAPASRSAVAAWVWAEQVLLLVAALSA